MMRSPIQRARAAMYPAVPPDIVQLGQQLQNNPHLAASIDGRDNLFAGTVITPRTASVIFMSRRMRRALANTTRIFCDATFASRPNDPQARQVLQFSKVVNRAIIPLGQVLMTGKSQAEYTAILQHIRQLVPQFNPTVVMTDFEAVLKKARELGLVPFMNQQRRLKSLIRSVCALPLLPQNLIGRGLNTLIQEARRRGYIQLLAPFFNYLIDTWMTNPLFSTMCVFNQPHRTNNVSESCNRMLRARTGAHRPGLWHFLTAVRRLEQRAMLTLHAARRGQQLNRARKVAAVNNDARITNLTRLLLIDGEISIHRYPPEIGARVTLNMMRSPIQRARAAMYPAVPPDIVQLGQQLQNNPHLAASIDGRDNLFAGTVITPRTASVIFMSRRMRRALANTTRIFCDATFASRPNDPQARQVLQFSKVVNRAIIPLGQVLMTGKSQAEYTAILQHIRQLVPQFNPTVVMTDFEVGLQNAWKAVFPNAQVVGCYCHFCRVRSFTSSR
ncbi:hypothetical protein FOCC_FOCC015210 [Frankliniella occidentalis]|nr:hypothetical protein FOCC_FOCC015210 [Frankliniella occidentalis]